MKYKDIKCPLGKNGYCDKEIPCTVDYCLLADKLELLKYWLKSEV